MENIGLLVTVVNAANSIEVAGFNFGGSYTWSPSDPIVGCGASNFAALTIVGPGGLSCNFTIALRCRTCEFGC